jgi:hypothetical protein
MKRPAPNLRAYAEINVEGREIQRQLKRWAPAMQQQQLNNEKLASHRGLYCLWGKFSTAVSQIVRAAAAATGGAQIKAHGVE